MPQIKNAYGCQNGFQNCVKTHCLILQRAGTLQMLGVQDTPQGSVYSEPINRTFCKVLWSLDLGTIPIYLLIAADFSPELPQNLRY